MSGAPVGVYPPEELKKMSEAEIADLLARDLYENAYETQSKAPVAFRGKALAETLETALYLCPKCHRIDTLHSRGDRFSCDCGLTMTLDEFGFFQGEDLPFKTPLDWDRWQTGEMEKLAEGLGDEPAFPDEDQTLNRKEDDHSAPHHRTHGPLSGQAHHRRSHLPPPGPSGHRPHPAPGHGLLHRRGGLRHHGGEIALRAQVSDLV